MEFLCEAPLKDTLFSHDPVGQSMAQPLLSNVVRLEWIIAIATESQAAIPLNQRISIPPPPLVKSSFPGFSLRCGLTMTRGSDQHQTAVPC